MKTVYVVRHGESDTNAGTTEICLPDADVQLTEKGREQSRFIAERAKSLPVDVIISSTYRRTRDTAAMIIEATNAPVEYSELFVECRTPRTLEGKPFHDPATEKIYRDWIEAFYDPDATVTDGEHFFDVRERALHALSYLEERPEMHIVVVSHGMFLRALVAAIMFGEALTPEIFRGISAATVTNNTGLTLLQYGVAPRHDLDGDKARWRVRAFNDHAHLG